MAHEWAKGLMATLLLIGLFFTVTPLEAWQVDTPRQETFPGLAESFFGPWALPFELLSLLLLAALVGSLYLGKKRGPEEGSP